MKQGNRNIVPDIRYIYYIGFEYPEVFSRAFKKQFGISPTKYRQNHFVFKGIPKAHLIEREIISYKGNLTLKGKSLFLEQFCLKGIFIESNTKSEDFPINLKSKVDNFINTSSTNDGLDQKKFYTGVNCHGGESGKHTVFCGRKPNDGYNIKTFNERIIPQLMYSILLMIKL